MNHEGLRLIFYVHQTNTDPVQHMPEMYIQNDLLLKFETNAERSSMGTSKCLFIIIRANCQQRIRLLKTHFGDMSKQKQYMKQNLVLTWSGTGQLCLCR